MNQQARLSWSLLLLRLGVFLVMLMWTLDKFVQPEHAAKVFEGFYGLGGFGTEIFYVLGALVAVAACLRDRLLETLQLRFGAGSARRIDFRFILQISRPFRQFAVFCRLAHAGRMRGALFLAGLRYPLGFSTRREKA